MDNNRDKALWFLDNVVTGFFDTGEMKFVTAYAMTAIATAYIEDSLGIDQIKKHAAMFEDAKYDETTFLIQDDDSIQNQIRRLEELKSLLTSSPVPARNTMILLKDDKGNSGIQWKRPILHDTE